MFQAPDSEVPRLTGYYVKTLGTEFLWLGLRSSWALGFQLCIDFFGVDSILLPRADGSLLFDNFRVGC